MHTDKLNATIELLYRELKCSVCFSMMVEPHSLPCLHIFCKSCIDRCLTSRPNCPLCNAGFHRRQVDPSPAVSTIIDIYKRLYKALSAISDIPCLSQALTPKPKKSRPSLDEKPDSKKLAFPHPISDRTTTKTEQEPASVEHNLQNTIQARTVNLNSDKVEETTPLRMNNAVEFRKLTTPIRAKPQAARPAADNAYTEPWSPYESSQLALDVPRCSVCYESDIIRPLLSCSECRLTVHCECYGVPLDELQNTKWACVPCSSSVSSAPACVLCPNKDDRAYRACSGSEDKWVHVSCALWAPQPKFSDTDFGNGGVVQDISKVPLASRKLRCVVCRKRGFCLQCEYGRCVTAFHVPCAARSKIRLELREMDEKVYFHQFCPAHAHLSKEIPTDNTAGSAFARRWQRRISLSPSPAPKRRVSLSSVRTRSRHEGRFVLLLTGLKLNDEISSFLANTKDVDFTMNCSDCVTHVVTKCYTSGSQTGKAKARTVKYMFGIARGIWCVSQMWIQDWMKFGHAPDELRYEVLGDYAAVGAPRRSRINRQQGKTPLFHDVVFIITGPFPKHLGLHIELAEIIKSAGGIVSNVIPDRQPCKPTVLIKEAVGPDEDESERREYASTTQQCLSIGIPVYDVQWLFGLLSYYSSPIISVK